MTACAPGSGDSHSVAEIEGAIAAAGLITCATDGPSPGPAGTPEVTSIEVFLAYLLAVNDRLVPVVGARRPETIRSLLAAARLTLEEDDLVTIDGRFPCSER